MNTKEDRAVLDLNDERTSLSRRMSLTRMRSYRNGRAACRKSWETCEMCERSDNLKLFGRSAFGTFNGLLSRGSGAAASFLFR